MTVRKLTIRDKEKIFPLFTKRKYMGVHVSAHVPGMPEVENDTTKQEIEEKAELLAHYLHNLFGNTYLTGLKSYHAFGKFDADGNVVCLIAFYVSQDDASWYWTHVKNIADAGAIKECLDAVIAYNEANGYYKFYSMFPKKYENTYRKLAFSAETAKRYGAFDEYFVKAKQQCKFNLAWQVLYNRRLLPVDTTVRLTYLKAEYREPTSGGNL